MRADLIAAQVVDGIAVLRLNRLEKRSAINDGLPRRLVAAPERIGADAVVRALIRTGNRGGLCAGGDAEAMAKRLDTPPRAIGT